MHTATQSNACDGTEEVDPAQLLDRDLDQALHFLLDAHVGLNCKASDLFRNGFGSVAINVANDHPTWACRSKTPAECGADSARPTGHDDRLTLCLHVPYDSQYEWVPSITS